MDQPVAGPATQAPAATPSNFADVMSQRAAAAEANGGMYQPNAGPPPNQGGMGWSGQQGAPQNGAQLTDFQYGDEMAVRPEPRLPQKPQDGVPVDPNHPPVPAENAPPEGEDEPVIEQLFDEHGEPIDMQAYNAQRTSIMQAMQEALDTGKLPYDVLKTMSMEVEVNGEKREVSLEEARGGYMRRAAFTRELDKAYGLQQDAQNMLQLERQRNEEWKDPQALRQGLRMLGLEAPFMKAAFEWAKERVSYMQMPPNERQLYDRLQQAELERENWQMQQRQFMQQQQMAQKQAGPDPNTQHIQKQLEQLMPRMFKMHQIGSYPLAQQTFIQQLQAYCPDGVVTAERANEAALATKEFLADLDKIRAEQTQVGNGQSPGNSQAQRWLGPRRLSAGPRPAMTMGNVMQQSPNGAGQKGGRRPSDFIRRMGLG